MKPDRERYKVPVFYLKVNREPGEQNTEYQGRILVYVASNDKVINEWRNRQNSHRNAKRADGERKLFRTKT